VNILILNGNPNPKNINFEFYLQELKNCFSENNHRVSVLTLREMDIKYCIGCWSCWWKTPGQCIVKDDSHDVCRQYINSDFVLFASPVIMGFPSALLKKTQDKLIPLIHPYIEIVNNECHHVKRYEHYPKLGLVLEKPNDTDDDDLKIITDIYKRFALNLKANLSFMKLTAQSVQEVCDAINHI